MTTKSELTALIARSLQIDQSPAYTSSTSVRVTGEAPHKPVYWTGKQWVVTAHGIEARDGTYAIAKQRIWEHNEGHGWVHRMSEKDWVDLPDFVEALRLARQRWPEK